MAETLLDVNVLIALLWPTHVLHEAAQRWFQQNARQGWATCAMTQAAFVRIVSNPSFAEFRLPIRRVMNVLRESVEHPAHRFWPDNIPFWEATAPLQEQLVGHHQTTDAYLLGLAIHRKGRLVTADRSMKALLPKNAPPNSLVVL